MGVLLDALRSVEFLDKAEDRVVTRFMALGRSTDHAARHVFWKAGALPLMLVVPITGEAKTSMSNAEGRELIDRFLGCGDCIGLPSALGGLPHTTDAHVTRSGEFFAISRAALVPFLDEHPVVRAAANSAVGGLYRRVMMEREAIALRSVPQRLAEFLLRHGCAREADGARVLLHATQAAIASRLGTVREVASRVLGDFQARGLVERDERGFHVRDWEGLEAEAGLDPVREDAASADAPWDTHRARTRRFFLPMVERGRRHEDTEDAASCRTRLGDLSLCRERGCPVALEDRANRECATRARRPVSRGLQVIASGPGPAASSARGRSAATR